MELTMETGNVGEKIKKFSTGVYGLDDLLYGGLRMNYSGSKKQPGIIIMLSGDSGVHKTLLAMQLLHGLMKSFRKEKILHDQAPLFFSLNKDQAHLEDMYLDFLVCHQVNELIQYSLSNENAAGMGSTFVDRWFSTTSQENAIRCMENEDCTLPSTWKEHMDFHIAKRNIYYNSRTNALHYRRKNKSDDNTNLLFYRKHSLLKEYCDDVVAEGSFQANKKKETSFGVLEEGFLNDFFAIGFNGKVEEEPKSGQFAQAKRNPRDKYYEQTVVDKYNGFSETIESSGRIPCVVIDGFSCMKSSDLERIPIDHLERILRQKSLVSVIVFDKRGMDFAGHADVVIEMRKNQTDVDQYVYFELQVSKSVFRTASLGWHKYKKRDDGLAVFPSLHRLLQKRHYMERIMDTTHKSFLLHELFEQYPKNVAFENYQEDQKAQLRKILKGFVRAYRAETGDRSGLAILKRILVGDGSARTLSPVDSKSEELEITDGPKPIVAFVGNPNSYKRFFALGGVYASVSASIADLEGNRSSNGKKQPEHTLIVLFDKVGASMKQKTLCPAMLPLLEAKLDSCVLENCSTCNKECPLTACEKCVNHIHYFPVRMGGIFADEFLYTLAEQLDSVYSDGGKVTRIVIDDLQKIDYSFPFLRKEPLFLPALMNLCRDRNVTLQVLCDKSSSLTHELCSLADTVLCFERSQEAVDSISIYMEHIYGNKGKHPCEIFKYEISAASKIFRCDGGHRLHLVDEAGHDFSSEDSNEEKFSIRCKEISTMKTFWRAKYDINPELPISVRLAREEKKEDDD